MRGIKPPSAGPETAIGGPATRADADDDVSALVSAIDAALDEASNLVDGVDLASLPEEVAQALGIMVAAETTVDELMEVMGLFDPDDAGENAAPAKPSA